MATQDSGRDILLAHNEYSYVQDLTKGTIDLSVGPTKISLSNTERLVDYNPETQRFFPTDSGVKPFVFASSSQYIVLENPAKEEVKYVKGSKI